MNIQKIHDILILCDFTLSQPFVNLITVIPITNDNNEVAFFVGLQVDLVEQPNAILEKMKDGTYLVNYQQMNIPPYIPGSSKSTSIVTYE